ncbi:MAG: signal peptidase I [Desulfurococcales archaeon]|nr:signal peptidase I [Desulfurococcales archaeon]
MRIIGREQLLLSTALLTLTLSLYTLLATVGVEVRYVATGSMEPTVPPGSLVVVRRSTGMDYMVGDIVLANYESIPLLHRVIGIDYTGGKLVTKGDNRDTVEVLALDKVEGVMVAGLPYIALPLIDPWAAATLIIIATIAALGVVSRWARE